MTSGYKYKYQLRLTLFPDKFPIRIHTRIHPSAKPSPPLEIPCIVLLCYFGTFKLKVMSRFQVGCPCGFTLAGVLASTLGGVLASALGITGSR